ncbi:MAG: hypothetical protein O7B29_03145 [Deltaproteobacteria bacterium]|nr:hypothetical protein [Deltaproteobacteria bacterium]
MTTIRSDVLVLGSTLGGLVAANYLARAGLRVVLLEEEVHAKRPTLLRDPFMLSGLASGGPVMRVLRELALPLIEQREIQRSDVALQVILPAARIDVVRGQDALAREIEAHGLGNAKALKAWLAAVDAQAARTQADLWEDATRPRGRGIGRLLADEDTVHMSAEPGLPPAPKGLDGFIHAQLAALSALESTARVPAPALLLHMTREGAFSMPHADTPFLELFRRRLAELHGEIRPLGSFSLVLDRTDVGLELPRGRLFGRALVIAVPREPLRRFLMKSGPAPAWLKRSSQPQQTSSRIFRAERRTLPQGMAERVIRADGRSPQELHWFVRRPDPEDKKIEWLVFFGPGTRDLPGHHPLGKLAPFSAPGIVPVDPGPTPDWDLDASGLRFPDPFIPASVRQRPPVVTVGPELAPGLGFEGELLAARRVALRLAERLGARRKVL